MDAANTLSFESPTTTPSDITASPSASQDMPFSRASVSTSATDSVLSSQGISVTPTQVTPASVSESSSISTSSSISMLFGKPIASNRQQAAISSEIQQPDVINTDATLFSVTTSLNSILFPTPSVSTRDDFETSRTRHTKESHFTTTMDMIQSFTASITIDSTTFASFASATPEVASVSLASSNGANYARIAGISLGLLAFCFVFFCILRLILRSRSHEPRDSIAPNRSPSPDIIKRTTQSKAPRSNLPEFFLEGQSSSIYGATTDIYYDLRSHHVDMTQAHSAPSSFPPFTTSPPFSHFDLTQGNNTHPHLFQHCIDPYTNMRINYPQSPNGNPVFDPSNNFYSQTQYPQTDTHYGHVSGHRNHEHRWRMHQIGSSNAVVTDFNRGSKSMYPEQSPNPESSMLSYENDSSMYHFAQDQRPVDRRALQSANVFEHNGWYSNQNNFV